MKLGDKVKDIRTDRIGVSQGLKVIFGVEGDATDTQVGK